MHYIYALITILLQSFGQVLTLLVGWVIAVHFGRVPTWQKNILSAMAAVSLIWTAMALSLSSSWLRTKLSMLNDSAVPVYLKLIIPLAGIGWFLLPLINGALGTYFKKRNNSTQSLALGVLSGYKYTPGFALALLLMVASLPLLILPPFLKGLRREHIMIMVKPGNFDKVLQEIMIALQDQGVSVSLKHGTLWQRSPFAILALFAHDLLGDWTKSRSRLIKGRSFQIVFHPADLVIEGNPVDVVWVRNTLLKNLTYSDAFLTWDGEAHAIEELINILRHKADRGNAREDIIRELDKLEKLLDISLIPTSEWESLYRQILQLRVRASA